MSRDAECDEANRVLMRRCGWSYGVWTVTSQRAREVEQSDQHTLIEVAGEVAERGLNILYELAWELTTSHVVQLIFSVQLPTSFCEKRAPLRSCGRHGLVLTLALAWCNRMEIQWAG